MTASQAKRLKARTVANDMLNRLLAEAMLDHATLNDVVG
jgi:hypothetical protein